MPDETLAPGCRIGGDLAVIERIAGGAATDIYLCRSRRLGRRAVCKRIKPAHLGDIDALVSLAWEGEVLQRLRHPGIVRGFGMVLETPPYLLMEYLPGGTLASAILSGNCEAFSPGEVLDMGVKVAEALEHAHRAGVAHMDVKPENIMYSDGRPVLIDFSVAIELDGAGRGAASRGGTSGFMAPEQEEGGPAGAYTDVYGLAATLRELLTDGGRRPMPPSIEPVVNRALASRPEDRFPSARRFAESLVLTAV